MMNFELMLDSYTRPFYLKKRERSELHQFKIHHSKFKINFE